MKKPIDNLRRVYTFLNVDITQGYDKVDRIFNHNWTLIQKKYIQSNRFLSFAEELYFKALKKFATLLYRKNVYQRRRTVMKLSKAFRNSKSNFEMDPRVRANLEIIFSAHIKKLEQILERDLSIWSEK